MTKYESLRTDLANRIHAYLTSNSGWDFNVVAIDDGNLRLITTNPRNKQQSVEEVVAIDLDEYAEVFTDEDERDYYAGRIAGSFLKRVIDSIPFEVIKPEERGAQN